jgi:hypothetical protein
MPARWWPPPALFHQNTCSIPPGSNRENAFLRAVAGWNNVGGASDVLFKAGENPSNDCVVTVSDGQNEVAIVPIANLPAHRLGTTFWEIDTFFGKFWEADVLVADVYPIHNTTPQQYATQTFGNPAEHLDRPEGRVIMMHEFGHAVGLAHVSSNFAVMRPNGQRPFLGGPTGTERADPFPDDAAGLRFVYPTGNPETNILVASNRLTPDNKVTQENTVPLVFLCPGAPLEFWVSIGNNGTTSVTHNQRYFLSAGLNDHGLTGYPIAGWYGATHGPNNAYMGLKSFPLPSNIPSGTYWLYHQVDWGNGVSESVEFDNVTRINKQVVVLNCY